MKSKVTIEAWRAFDYSEVFQIIEMKNECVYKTKFIGFAHNSRSKKENEIYASLSTKLLKQKSITLELMD